jgi:serine/threonine protein kinase
VVYKASDLQADMRRVAVKLFAKSQAHKLFAKSQAHTRLRREFFSRECRALQELRHPAIIELLDWGIDEPTGERFLVLDWMEETLESRRGDRFEGWDSFYDDIGRPILEALSFGHGRRVWHRDLKPANVLLDAAGRPKLADFSIAKVDQRWDPSRTVGALVPKGKHDSPRGPHVTGASRAASYSPAARLRAWTSSLAHTGQ